MKNKELVSQMLLCPLEENFVYSLKEKRWYTYGQIWENAVE